MTVGQFSKSNAGKPTATKPATKPKASRWAGVKSSKPRDPVIHAGVYRLEIVNGEPGRTGEYFKVHFKIADQGEGQSMHAVGDSVIVLFRTVDDAGQSRCKAFFVAASGCEDDEAYDAHDPDGAKIDAFFDRGEDSDLAGRLVDVNVRRGKEREDGDYYREFEWSPVEQ
jgi:hypothetical protein